MYSWANLGGLPFLEGQGVGVLLPGLGATCGLGGGGRRVGAELSGLGAEQAQVRARARAGLHSAWSLVSGRAVRRSSHLSSGLQTQPQLGILPAEDPSRGPSAGERIHQLLLAKPPEAAASSLRKLPGQRGRGLRTCREPAPSLGGGVAVGVSRAGAASSRMLTWPAREAGGAVGPVWRAVTKESSR